MRKINEIEKDFIQHDKLDRSKELEIVCNIIDKAHTPFVLTIDSSWGTGKFYFNKMIEERLQTKSFSLINYNAWENDISNNALISITAEISGTIKEILIKNGIKDYEKIIDKFYHIIGKLIIKSGSIFIEKMTYSIIDREDIKNFLKSKPKVKELTKYLIDDHKENKDLLLGFKNQLKQLTKILGKNNLKLPIVVIIDELDRCRPTYAVELLEVLKHLFSVEGFVFILSIDLEQLQHSIGTLYGVQMDKIGYLRRFIDLEYKLPEPSLDKFIPFLIDNYDINENLTKSGVSHFESKKHLEHVLLIFCKGLDLSLRDIDKMMNSLFISLLIYKKNNEPFIIEALCFLLCLKYGHEKIYNQIKLKSYRTNKRQWRDDLLSIIKIDKVEFMNNSMEKRVVDALIQDYLSQDIFNPRQFLEVIKNIENSEHIQAKALNQDLLNRHHRYINDNKLQNLNPIRRIIEHIEISDTFSVP